MYSNYQTKTNKVTVFIKSSILLLLFICSVNEIKAQNFVYRPINPAFGGNFYNYSWMLSSAQAQNTYTATNSTVSRSTTATNSLDSFSDNLTRQLLSRISSQVLQNQFSEESLKEGTYQYGDLRLDVKNGRDGINIRIIDNKGGETVITIPYF